MLATRSFSLTFDLPPKSSGLKKFLPIGRFTTPTSQSLGHPQKEGSFFPLSFGQSLQRTSKKFLHGQFRTGFRGFLQRFFGGVALIAEVNQGGKCVVKDTVRFSADLASGGCT